MQTYQCSQCKTLMTTPFELEGVAHFALGPGPDGVCGTFRRTMPKCDACGGKACTRGGITHAWQYGMPYPSGLCGTRKKRIHVAAYWSEVDCPACLERRPEGAGDIVQAPQEDAEADDTCGACEGTGIGPGRFGDADASTCGECDGTGARKGGV